MSTQGQGDVVELLPCPFCGGEVMRREALWPSEGDTDGIIHRDPGDCPLHRATPDFSLGYSDGCRSTADGWNTRTLLSSSRGEQGWLAIENAPKTRPIIGKTAAGRIVKAKWVRLDDDNAGWGTPEEDDPRPNCWNDGFCWASNSDEQPSDPLVAYIEMPGSVPTSLAGQVPDGYVLVPKDLTLEVERSIAYAVAVARQGASSTPRCESPTEYDIDTAHAWVRRVVAALSKRFSMPPSRDCHSRDCEYVTTDGPAPCTCGFVERDCNAAVARAALQSSPQPTAGRDAPTIAHGSFPDDEPECCPRCGNAWEQPDPFALANGIDRAIKQAVSAERARVIEECARVAEAEAANARSRGALDISQEYTAPLRVAAALRALAQQDTGGADHG